MTLGWLLKRSRREDSGWRFVLLLPVAVFFADILENLVLSRAIAAFPNLGAVGNALPVVTATKFGAVIATMVAVIVLALLWIRDRMGAATRLA